MFLNGNPDFLVIVIKGLIKLHIATKLNKKYSSLYQDNKKKIENLKKFVYNKTIKYIFLLLNTSSI